MNVNAKLKRSQQNKFETLLFIFDAFVFGYIPEFRSKSQSSQWVGMGMAEKGEKREKARERLSPQSPFRVLAKSRLILDETCRLYEKFSSYVRRVLFLLVKMALLFPNKLMLQNASYMLKKRNKTTTKKRKNSHPAEVEPETFDV